MSAVQEQSIKPLTMSKEDFDADCRKYMQLHAKQARLKARMEELSGRIKPELQTGRKSPKDLPYALVLRKRLLTLYEWKGALVEQLKFWLTPEETTKRMELIEANFPQKESEALYVEINKTYAAKL